MNKSILYVIAAKTGGLSALYVDAIEKSLTDEEMQTIGDLSFNAGKHKSPWLGRVDGYIFFKGFFGNKDDKGNEMSFSYCVKATTLKEAKAIFLSDINKNGYRLSAETQKCLESSQKLNYKTIGIVAMIIVLLVMLLITILR